MKLVSIDEGEIEIEMKSELQGIKENLENIIKSKNVKNGKMECHLPHEVAAFIWLGWESGLKKDMLNFLKDILPAGKYKEHDEPGTPFRYNFYQHAQVKLVGEPTLILQIKDNKLYLGKYQDIMILEPVFKEIPKLKIFYRLYIFGD
ncbi:MAG: YjbQ family protein [Candidatus Aenigmarchaeota archaeon]|nr:YjbQ family protein [Candidatus Aenigmarchaeota archaeon]